MVTQQKYMPAEKVLHGQEDDGEEPRSLRNKDDQSLKTGVETHSIEQAAILHPSTKVHP